MDIKIGILHSGREVTVDSASSADEVFAEFHRAVSEGGVLRLTEAKGRVVMIPTSSIGYLDCGQDSSRPVGFGSV